MPGNYQIYFSPKPLRIAQPICQHRTSGDGGYYKGGNAVGVHTSLHVSCLSSCRRSRLANVIIQQIIGWVLGTLNEQRCHTSWDVPTGGLEQLSILHLPWLHIAEDLITNLPVSRGFRTTFITIAFLRACYLMPLPKLPMALKTAEAIFSNVFCTKRQCYR